MLSRNKIGPMTESCGTPKKTADGTEVDVVVRTCCISSLRYDVNQSKTFPPRPCVFLNRRRRVLWSTHEQCQHRYVAGVQCRQFV